MNERMKELAEQAWDATAVSPEFGHPVSFAEKFAELIVRECSKVLFDKQDLNYWDKNYLSGWHDAGLYIEKHFRS